MIGLIIIAGLVLFIVIACSFAWYRIVPSSEAHLVVTPKGKFVASPDEDIGTKRTYFAIPSMIPFFGRTIRTLPTTIEELKLKQETIEKNQARYNVESSTKFRIVNVKTAAETFIDGNELKQQLNEVIMSGIRAVTVQFEVQDARAKKKQIEDKIREEIEDDFENWGLKLINFQLVDFSDTDESNIITDISKRNEAEISSKTRQLTAERNKEARIKEAESEELASQREIAKDKVIKEKEEEAKQAVSVKQKTAEEKRFDVVKVQTIKQAEIDKEKAIVIANQEKETEEIRKQKLKLEGEGEYALAAEMAKAEAAPIREKGKAEAEAKELLQDALNKFTPEAIRALVAERMVVKDENVGVAAAKALEQADLKVFSGSGEGFELGKLISSIGVSNSDTEHALNNKIGRPNDMGLTSLGLKALAENKKNN